MAQLSDTNRHQRVMIESSTQTEPDHLRTMSRQVIDLPMNNAPSQVWHTYYNSSTICLALTVGYSAQSEILPKVEML
jgi:hypothetical protein